MNQAKGILITKRDSTTEPYSYDKLVTSLLKAGLLTEQANLVSQRMESWVVQNAVDGKIDSSIIRDKIIELLLSEYPAEADSYKAFKKE